MQPNVTPVRDRLLVKPVKKEEKKTDAGIFIQEKEDQEPVHGTVVAAGSGAVTRKGKKVQMIVQTGDRVLFSTSAGLKVNIDGVDYVVLREKEILATLD